MSDSNLKFLFKPPVYIADEQSHADAIKILNAEPWERPKAVQSFNTENREYFELAPIHTEEDPILFMGRHSVYMWTDSDQNNWIETVSGNKVPDFNETIAVLCDIELDENGDIKSRIPSAVMVGDNFQGVLEYSALSSEEENNAFNALIIVKNAEGDTTYHTRDALTTKDEIKQFFEKLLENGKQGQGIFRSSDMIAMIYAQHVGLDARMEMCPRSMFKSIHKAELNI